MVDSATWGLDIRNFIMPKNNHGYYRVYVLLKRRYASSCFIANSDQWLKWTSIITEINSRLWELWCSKSIETLRCSYSLVNISSFSYPLIRYIYQHSAHFPAAPSNCPVTFTYPRIPVCHPCNHSLSFFLRLFVCCFVVVVLFCFPLLPKYLFFSFFFIIYLGRRFMLEYWMKAEMTFN